MGSSGSLLFGWRSSLRKELNRGDDAVQHIAEEGEAIGGNDQVRSRDISDSSNSSIGTSNFASSSMALGARSTFSHWPEEDVDGFARLQVASASTYCDTSADLSSRLPSISATMSEVSPHPGVSQSLSDHVRNEPPIDEFQSEVDDAYKMLASALNEPSESVQFHSSAAPVESQSLSTSPCNKLSHLSCDDEELMDMILREADI